MKVQWNTLAFLLLAGCMASPLSVLAQDAPVKRSKVIVIEEKGSDDAASEPPKADGDKKENAEKRSHVAVVQANGTDADKILEMVESQLKNSGVDDETRQNVLKQLKAKMKDSGEAHTVQVEVRADQASGQDGEREASLDLKLDGEAIVIGADGKQQRVRLRMPQGGVANGKLLLEGQDKGDGVMLFQKLKQPNTMQMFQSMVNGGVSKAQMEKMKTLLKKHGLDDDAIAEVMGVLQNDKMMMPGLQASSGSGRFVIGVALTTPQEFAEGDEDEDEDEDEGDDEEHADRLVVTEIFDGSPAAQAGIVLGDAFLAVNGKPLGSMQDLVSQIQEAGQAKRSIKVTIRRQGEEKEVEITPRKDAGQAGIGGLPSQLQEALQGLPNGVDGAFVVPPNAMNERVFKFDSMEDSLKKDMESLKKEMKELKGMLKSLKKD